MWMPYYCHVRLYTSSGGLRAVRASVCKPFSKWLYMFLIKKKISVKEERSYRSQKRETENCFSFLKRRTFTTRMFLNILNLTRWNALRPFKVFFQQLHWPLQLPSCFIKWYEKEWSIKLWGLPQWRLCETLNLVLVSSCECLHFVMSYIKHNRKRFYLIFLPVSLFQNAI